MTLVYPKLGHGRALGALVVLLCVLCARGALAAPTAADRERARALMDAGDARFEAKNYASALEQYRAADDIMGVPTTGIEVGRTLERLGQLLEAREILRRVSEFPQRADEPKPFASARQRADRLLSDIAPRIPRVTLEVAGLPAGVKPRLTWDGQPLDAAKLGGYLETNPGAHRLTGAAPGFPDVKRDIKLAEGQALQVVLTFSNVNTAAPAAATTPPPTNPPPLSQAPSQPPPDEANKPALPWIGVGVAAVGVATGTVTGLYSLSRTSRAKQHCQDEQCAPAAKSDIDSARTFANVSNVAFGVGVAGLGFAAWRFFTHHEPSNSAAHPESRHVHVAVGLGDVSVTAVF
jgi:hypothetical protein